MRPESRVDLDTLGSDSCIYDTVYLRHPQTSVWCSWIINSQLTHLPIPDLWFLCRVCCSLVFRLHTTHQFSSWLSRLHLTRSHLYGWDLFFGQTLSCYLCHRSTQTHLMAAQQILNHPSSNLQKCCIRFHLITHFSAPQIWRCLTLTRRVSSCMWRHSSACFPKVSPWKPSRRWRRCREQPQPASAGWRQRSITRFRPSSASPSRLGSPAPWLPCDIVRARFSENASIFSPPSPLWAHVLCFLNLRKGSLL